MTTSQAALSESFSLILDLAITNTELALVKLPEPVYTLTEDEFAVTSLDYGSHALEQDIFCWLIYPQWRSQVNLPFSQSCFPQPGNPDPLKRQEFAQYLQQYPLGRAFLEAARLSKLILQEQAAFTSELTNQPWGITRSEISDKIIQPFLELIDYQINLLLSQRKITNVGIGQVFVSGETSLAIEYVLSVWLRDKFPQANIAFASHQDSLSSVLLGLVSSPFFPFLTKYAPKKNFH